MTGGEATEPRASKLDAATMFGTIDNWVKLISQFPLEVEPHSPLAGDDQKLPTLQVSHAAWNGIVHSVDHLHSLRLLLDRTGVLTLYAPFTLVRSAMDNAATAVWLLAPSKRSERLRRRLKLARREVREAGEAYRLFEELGEADTLKGRRTPQERLDQIRTLADQLKLPVDDILGNLGYEKIIRAAGEAIDLGGDLSALEWRLCSGFTHGQYWASFSLLDRQVFATQAPGVLNVRLTNDIEKVMLLLQFPFILTLRALQLYEQRRRSPYSTA
jgi:hypothetical protein